MTNEEIVKALRCRGNGPEEGCANCAFEPICDEDAVTCDADLCAAAADRLEELVERCARYAEEITVLRERQRWIPVAERLPEDDATVLTYKNGIAEVQKYEKGRNGWVFNGWFWSLGNVDHWMPLPEAPEVVE